MAINDTSHFSVFQYPAFGLYITSNVSVPGLTAAPNPGFPDVKLTLGCLPLAFDPARYPNLWFQSRYITASGEPILRIFTSKTEPLEYWLRYSDGVNMVAEKSATSLWVSWPDSLCIEDAVTYLLGPVMAFIAQIRGTTCLHGSAVAIDGYAAVLLGPQGAGKSTSAAAFACAGYPVIADDLILLNETENGLVVEPSYPILRLWPASVELLFGSEDALPRLSPSWEKRGLNLEGADYCFQRAPLPLAAVYFLEPRVSDPSAPSLAPIGGAPALVRLISNSWAHYADKPSILARQLAVLTKLSQSIPLRNLCPNDDPARLPALRELIVSDVRALRAGAPARY